MPVTIGGSGPVTGVTSINTTVSDTELGYLDGVTSAIQTQINGKADYSTGSWTPALAGSSTNPTVTYTWQYGRYVKIGELVYIQCDVRWSALSGGSGSVSITGLPFTASASNGRRVLTIQNLANAFTGSYLTAEIAESGTAISISGNDNAGTQTAMTVADLKTNATAYFRVTGFYAA